MKTSPPRIPSLVMVPLVTALLGCAPGAGAAAPATGAPSPAAPAHAAGVALRADTGVVRVSGTATVSVPADRARLRFAVESRAADAAAAARANAREMEAVHGAVRTALGDAGEISTEGYGLTPEYSRPEPGDPDGRRIVAYRALNHVAVTVTNLDRVARVLDAAVDAGANRVSQLAFVAGDTREARLEAIEQATARATEEARVLAAALGVELGAVLDVSVSPEDRGGGPLMRMAMMESADVATPVAPGTQEVQVTVSVTWRLGPGSR